MMVDAKTALMSGAVTRNLLANIDGELSALEGQFRMLVEWTNSQGLAQHSATLYKLMADVQYLRAVTPGLTEALDNNATDVLIGFNNG